MNVKIISVKLTNWKGADEQEFVFNGNSAAIKAYNSLGKSRLADAIVWTLTGKSMDGRLNYEIKNTEKTEMNRLDHRVDLKLDIDGREVILSRVYKEVHAIETGSTERRLTGHTTEFWFNGQLFSDGQYKELIKSYAPEKVWNMMLNPLFFNTDSDGWKWTDRRDVLIKMAGEITDEDILSSVKGKVEKFDELRKLLQDGIDLITQKSTLVAKKVIYQKEFNGIDPAIKALHSQLPTETDAEFLLVDAEIAGLKLKDQKIVDEITEVKNAGREEIEKFNIEKNKVLDVKAQANNIFLAKKREYKSAFDNKEADKQAVASKISRVKQTIVSNERLKGFEVAKKNGLLQEIESAKEEFLKTKASTFIFDGSRFADTSTCPTCGTVTETSWDLEAISAGEEAEFNTKRSNKMISLRQVKVDKEAAMEPLDKLIQDYEDAIVASKSEIELLEAEYNALESGIMPTDAEILEQVKSDPECVKLMNEIALLESVLPEMPKPVDTDEYQVKREEIAKQIKEKTVILAKKSQKDSLLVAIAKQEAREKELAQLIADIEKSVNTISVFNDSKMSLVEKRVNDLFTGVSFKLFRRLVNGADENICTMIFEDKTFSSLNTAAKIHAGMYCIQTLSKYFSVSIPMIIDNAESKFEYPEMGGIQVIKLFASEADRVLRIELEP